MDDDSRDDLRDRLRGELLEAYDRFEAELQATPHWGLWVVSRRRPRRRRIFATYSASQLAGIYRRMLFILFAAGVVLSLVSEATRGLGVALVVGSLFAFGAWVAQAWNLSREEEFRTRDELLGGLRQREEVRHYAALIKDITNRIEELDRSHDTMSKDSQ